MPKTPISLTALAAAGLALPALATGAAARTPTDQGVYVRGGFALANDAFQVATLQAASPDGKRPFVGKTAASDYVKTPAPTSTQKAPIQKDKKKLRGVLK